MNFVEIIDQHGNKVFRYCFHMLRHKQEAEDAAQEIFIKAYEKHGTIKDKQAFDSWLYKTAYRHCLNVIRRKKLFSFVSVFDPTFQNDFIELQYEIFIDNDITVVLNKLSPSDRTMIYLRILEDKSYETIARIMGISCTAARKQYERARKRVKKLIQAESEVEVNEKISII